MYREWVSQRISVNRPKKSTAEKIQSRKQVEFKPSNSFSYTKQFNLEGFNAA